MRKSLLRTLFSDEGQTAEPSHPPYRLQDTTTGLLLTGIGQVENDGNSKNFAIIDVNKVSARGVGPSECIPVRDRFYHRGRSFTSPPATAFPGPGDAFRHHHRTSKHISPRSHRSARTLPSFSSISTSQRRSVPWLTATSRPSQRSWRFLAKSTRTVSAQRGT